MGRIQSVDTFRFFAIVAVIAIHTSPFDYCSGGDDEPCKCLQVAINQLARFAVPFFFVISGYFWGAKIRHGGAPIPTSLRAMKRIGGMFLFWCLVYLVPFNTAKFAAYGTSNPLKVAYWNLSARIHEPIDLLTEGTSGHLWFLVALLCAMGISALFVHERRTKGLMVLAVTLYAIGVFARAYGNTPLSMVIYFNTRNGPFFATLLFVSGYWLSGLNANANWLRYGAMLFGAGVLLHFSEIFILWKRFGTSPEQEYVFGTYFMGLGVAMMSLSDHPRLQSKLLSQVGKLTLGIYAVHYIYVDLFRAVDKRLTSPFWQIGYIAVVLLLSTVTAMLLSRNRWTRRFVA